MTDSTNDSDVKINSDTILSQLSNLGVSLSDIEDLFSDNHYGADNDFNKDVSQGGAAADQYRRAGTFLTTDALKNYFSQVLSESYRLMGQGGNRNQFQLFLTRLDRHGTVITPLNTINQGFTFITRPRLNLTSGNLKQHPVLSTLLANDPNSVTFMLRALMDTRLSNGSDLTMDFGKPSDFTDNEISSFSLLCKNSGLFDVRNPFFVPLCNGLKGISGFPDFNLEVETTEGDFHSGDFSFVKGSDMNNRTQELSLEFRDVQGSVILSCFYYWCLYMALQAKGVVMAYQDDIYLQRLNYTVSIYRFLVDPTRHTILWWAKATGCFPKSVPIGALFNVAQGEEFISSATNFSIPFTANDIKVNDPGILLDFNALVQRYCSDITDDNAFTDVDSDIGQTTAGLNFIGLPIIRHDTDGLKMVWRTNEQYLAYAGITKGKIDPSQGDTDIDKAYVDAQYARNLEINRILNALDLGQNATQMSAADASLAEDAAAGNLPA